jgi:hypothetical protein
MNWGYSEQQLALIERIWTEPGFNLKKECATLFPGKSYQAIVKLAHRKHLGPRKHSDRGRPGFARQQLLDELKKHPGTPAELMRRTKLSCAVTYRWMNDIPTGPRGEIHIRGWQRHPTGGEPSPISMFGPGEDMPRPSALTNTAKSRTHRARARVRNEGAVTAQTNPFATAIGLVRAPEAGVGRIYRQPMNVKDEDEVTA